MEIWKDIKNYEGMYQISNLGNVRTLDYYVNSSNGARLKPSRTMTPTDNGNGYKIIGLSKNNKRKNFYIHRLVAEAFLENPNNCEQVNHKDYNKGNNSVDNLEWVTPQENVIYSLPNRTAITSQTNKYGKYIKLDKRYNSFVVVVNSGIKQRKYLGSFKTVEEAMICRDAFYRDMQKII